MVEATVPLRITKGQEETLVISHFVKLKDTLPNGRLVPCKCKINISLAKALNILIIS